MSNRITEEEIIQAAERAENGPLGSRAAVRLKFLNVESHVLLKEFLLDLVERARKHPMLDLNHLTASSNEEREILERMYHGSTNKQLPKHL